MASTSGAKNLQDLVGKVRSGLPTGEVNHFIGVSKLERVRVLDVMGISQRTLERRAKTSLSQAQSDRLARVKRVFEFAVAMIGSDQRARKWLQEPNRALKGEVPITLLDTDAGARLVEDELVRISDGIFA